MKGGVPNLPKAKAIQLELGEKLTAKEAKELQPRVEEVIRTILKGMDKGITFTNKEKAEAIIWQTLDKEEVSVIASLLVEGGQASRIVATSVRKITGAHRMLQIGLITLPRFLMTVQHYRSHGGFTLPFGDGGMQGGTNQPEARRA